MKNSSKIMIFVFAAILTTTTTSTIWAKTTSDSNGKKFSELTIEQQQTIQKNELAVDNMLSDAETDIVSNFKIDTKAYLQLTLKDIPSFENGKFGEFTDDSFRQKALAVIDNELSAQPIGALMPVIFLGEKDLIFAYKDKDGKDYLKKYKFNNNEFQKVYDTSKAGKKFSIDQYRTE